MRARFQIGKKAYQYPVEVPQHIIVPKTNDPIPERIQIGCSHGVSLDAVLTTVNLNNEPPLNTAEINDVAPQ